MKNGRFVVLVDHRENNGFVSMIQDEHDNVMLYGSDELDEAKKLVQEHHFAKHFPCYILDLDNGEVLDV